MRSIQYGSSQKRQDRGNYATPRETPISEPVPTSPQRSCPALQFIPSCQLQKPIPHRYMRPAMPQVRLFPFSFSFAESCLPLSPCAPLHVSPHRISGPWEALTSAGCESEAIEVRGSGEDMERVRRWQQIVLNADSDGNSSHRCDCPMPQCATSNPSAAERSSTLGTSYSGCDDPRVGVEELKMRTE